MKEEFQKCSGTSECEVSVAAVHLKVFRPTKTDRANTAIDQPLLDLDDGYVDTASVSAFLHI